MNIQALFNIVLVLVFMVIPLIAEWSTATNESVPGTGFDVLLYKPFDFAYLVLVAIFLIGGNCYFSAQKSSSIFVGAGIGIVVTLIWFVITFLAVAQFHVSLGGKL
jgi:hypothetical protein